MLVTCAIAMLASSAPVAAHGTELSGAIQTTRHITSAPGFPGTICGDGASPDDCLALVSMYNAFGGPGSRACPTTDPKSPTVLDDPWHGWLGGETYCSWTGVECNDGGYVRTLQLPVSCQSQVTQPTPPFNAPYQLPPGIGRFVEVEEIYLPYIASRVTNIAINGTVPEQFTNLTTLRTFVVESGTVFSGVIPDAIGKLTELTSISFLTNGYSGSRISGTLPASVAEMSSLTELVIENTISGSIPAGFFDKLVALETVAITGGQWRGPYPTKFASPALRSLSLGDLGNMTKTGTTLSIDTLSKGALVKVNINANNFTSISADFINQLNVSFMDAPEGGQPSCTLDLPDLSLDGVLFPCDPVYPPRGNCTNSTACIAALTSGSVSSYSTYPCRVSAGYPVSSVHCIG